MIYKNKKILNNLQKIHPQGFTLIELLVVIAIIALLSVVIIIQFGNVRAKARDLIRITDLLAIQKGLEAYIDDYGSIPHPGSYRGEGEMEFDSTHESLVAGRPWLPFLKGTYNAACGQVLNPNNIQYLYNVPMDPLEGSSACGSPWWGCHYEIIVDKDATYPGGCPGHDAKECEYKCKTPDGKAVACYFLTAYTERKPKGDFSFMQYPMSKVSAPDHWQILIGGLLPDPCEP